MSADLSTTEVHEIVQTLKALAEGQAAHVLAQARMLEQQGVLVLKLGQVITQLNKHSLYLVQHERAVARCLNCRNYEPSDPLADTAALEPPHSEVVYPSVLTDDPVSGVRPVGPG